MCYDDVVAGHISEIDYIGNKAADEYAKRASYMHELPSVHAQNYLMTTAIMHKIMAFAVGVVWKTSVKQVVSFDLDSKAKPDLLQLFNCKHSWVLCPKGLVCLRCRRICSSKSSFSFAQRLSCRPFVSELDAEAVVHKSHVLMSSSGLIWCANCGAYATQRAVYLRDKCRKKPLKSGRDAMHNLERGYSPGDELSKVFVGTPVYVKPKGKVVEETLLTAPFREGAPTWAVEALTEYRASQVKPLL